MRDSTLASAAALCAAAGGLYGSYQTESAAPAGFALSFVVVFMYALHRVQASSPALPKNQILLVLAMICLSFGLHTVYLPAGICCFFTLMLCKNELLMPNAAPPSRACGVRVAWVVPPPPRCLCSAH